MSVVLALTFVFGIYNVYHQGTHHMRQLAAAIQEGYTPGDAIINADFYTYF